MATTTEVKEDDFATIFPILMKNLSTDMVLKIESRDEDLIIEKIPVEQTINECSNNEIINLVGMILRPGMSKFLIELEMVHFNPVKNPDLNDRFVMRFMKYENLVFSVVSIPSEYMNTAKACAEDCGMKIVHGVPTMICESLKQFPISGNNVFTIESAVHNGIKDRIEIYPI